MSLTDMTTKCRGCDGSGDCPACGGKGVRTEEASRDERIKAVVARHRGEYTGAQQEDAVKCSACGGSGKHAACSGSGQMTFLDGLRSKLDKARAAREERIAARIARAASKLTR